MAEKIEHHTDLPGAAGMLASYAKLTANNSGNWSAFEAIALDVLKAVYKAGAEHAAPDADGGHARG